MVEVCGRVKLLPSWLKGRERGTHNLVKDMHPASPMGQDLRPSHKVPPHKGARLVKDGGSFCSGEGTGVESGAASHIAEAQEAERAIPGLGFLLPPFYFFWAPSPWDGANHNKGEFSSLSWNSLGTPCLTDMCKSMSPK